jgi:hypothetical protein
MDGLDWCREVCFFSQIFTLVLAEWRWKDGGGGWMDGRKRRESGCESVGRLFVVAVCLSVCAFIVMLCLNVDRATCGQ